MKCDGKLRSYVDETSICRQVTQHKRRVSIHAQVLSNSSLDWIAPFLDLCQGGELKAKALMQSGDLPFLVKQLESGHSVPGVVIHVVDVSSYYGDLELSLRKTKVWSDLPRDQRTIEAAVAWWKRRCLKAGKMLEKVFLEDIGRRILANAPAVKIKQKALFHLIRAGLKISPLLQTSATAGFGLVDGTEGNEENQDDLSFFRDGEGKYANPNIIAKAVSKSGPVFVGPLNEISDEGTTGIAPLISLMKSARMVSMPHGFDVGDEKLLGWVDRERPRVIDALDFLGAYRPEKLGRLESLKSEQHLPIQAADLAAGITRWVVEDSGGEWSRRMKIFPEVIYNGNPCTPKH